MLIGILIIILLDFYFTNSNQKKLEERLINIEMMLENMTPEGKEKEFWGENYDDVLASRHAEELKTKK